MNFKFFHSRSTFALLLLAVLLLIGLLFCYQRVIHSKVNCFTEEVTANIPDHEICQTDLYEQKSQKSREFLLNRDYEKAFVVLQELLTENNLSTEDEENISFALIFTCLMLDNYDEAIVQINRQESKSQDMEWQALKVYIDIRNRDYNEAIKKLEQIEKILEDDPFQQVLVYWIRSAIYLSLRQPERAKIDLDNLLRVIKLISDDSPDGMPRFVNTYQECFNLLTTSPENYSFDFDNTLPHPEKSAEGDGKIFFGIVFVWELISTVDGSVVHTCSIAL